MSEVFGQRHVTKSSVATSKADMNPARACSFFTGRSRVHRHCSQRIVVKPGRFTGVAGVASNNDVFEIDVRAKWVREKAVDRSMRIVHAGGGMACSQSSAF